MSAESNSFFDLLRVSTRRLSEAHERAIEALNSELQELRERNSCLASQLQEFRAQTEKSHSNGTSEYTHQEHEPASPRSGMGSSEGSTAVKVVPAPASQLMQQRSSVHRAPSVAPSESSSEASKSAFSDITMSKRNSMASEVKPVQPLPPSRLAPLAPLKIEQGSPLLQRRKSLELPSKRGSDSTPKILRRRSFDGIPGIVLEQVEHKVASVETDNGNLLDLDHPVRGRGSNDTRGRGSNESLQCSQESGQRRPSQRSVTAPMARRPSEASTASKISRAMLMPGMMNEESSMATARLSRSSRRRGSERNGITELWPVWKEGLAAMKWNGSSCGPDSETIRVMKSMQSCPSSGKPLNEGMASGSVSTRGSWGGRRLHLVNIRAMLKQARRIRHRVVKTFVTPNSPAHLLLDTLGLLFIQYDLIEIPMRVFDPPETGLIVAMGWICACFWTINMALEFVKGYQQDGVVITDSRKVVTHYVQTWFLYDLIVVVADWLTLLFAELKEGSFLRILRLVRLLRLIKVGGLLQETSKYIQSEYVLTLFSVAKFLSCILIVNHFIACGWYGIGSAFTEDTWVTKNIVEGDTRLYSYSTALHWSLTQFTPASMEVVPQNTIERIFTVLVLLFAMVTFSSFVSSITNAMTHLRRLNSQRLAQHAALRQFLREHRVSSKLVGRIWTCVRKNRDASKSSIHRKDVAVLVTLPKHVQNDLLSEIYVPVLSRHPFFCQYILANPSVVRRIVQEALEEWSIGIGQEIFGSGEPAESMLFIRKGFAKYRLLFSSLVIPTDPEEDPEADQPLKEGRWVVEPVLWFKWIHRGTMSATTPCEIVALVAKTFQGLAAQHLHEFPQPAIYADLFLRHFFAASDEPVSEGGGSRLFPLLTDVWAESESLNVFTMGAFMAVQQEMGKESVNTSYSRADTAESDELESPMKGVVPR